MKKVKSLKELIPMYGETKQQADELKKTADAQNKQIKKQMSKLLTDDVNSVDKEVDGWVATYQLRISESFNEEALIEYINKTPALKGCVKTVQVIDSKKLEDVLYNGKVPKKVLLDLDKFRTKKKTEYLYIKRKES